MTYSLGDIGLSAESTVEADGIVHGHDLNTLSTSDVGVCRVAEQGRDERRPIHASDVAGIVGTVQNVVLEEGGNGAGIILDHAGNRSILEEFLEGIVAWGQDGDVPQTAKVSEKTGLSADKAWTGQYEKGVERKATTNL
jgi:hypothetical protein